MLRNFFLLFNVSSWLGVWGFMPPTAVEWSATCCSGCHWVVCVCVPVSVSTRERDDFIQSSPHNSIKVSHASTVVVLTQSNLTQSPAAAAAALVLVESSMHMYWCERIKISKASTYSAAVCDVTSPDHTLFII